MLTTRGKKHTYQKAGSTPIGMQKNLRRFENAMNDSNQKQIDMKKPNILDRADLNNSLTRIEENELYKKNNDPISKLFDSHQKDPLALLKLTK